MTQQKDEIQDFINIMKDLQQHILKYIEEAENEKHNFHNLIHFIDARNIRQNKHIIQALLHLLLKISNNHHRFQGFFHKISQIFIEFSNQIKQFYTNKQLFNTFKSNKQVLYILFGQNLLVPDQSIAAVFMTKKCIREKYPHYFYNNFSKFFKNKFKREILDIIREDDPEMDNLFPYDPRFEENRIHGENPRRLCKLIRDDSLHEFKQYVDSNNLNLFMTIKQSVFETNPFLLSRETTLAEYASFYGSLKILKYLYENQVELTSSLWIYSVHSQNIDVIHFIEQKSFKVKEKVFIYAMLEAVRCLHKNVADYIMDNYIKYHNLHIEGQIALQSIKDFNYEFFPHIFDFNHFFYLCKRGYFYLVQLILNKHSIELNTRIIFFSLLYKISINCH